jgi:ubiquinone/menaquinone biosynthesis C-methylase UbiE
MAVSSGKNTDAIVAAYSGGEQLNHYLASASSGLSDYEEAVIKAHFPDTGIRVLNLGSGGGRESFGFYRLGYRNVIGLDPSRPLLDAARRSAAEQGYAIEFIEGMADSVPLPDASIDLVTMLPNLYGLITPKAARIDALREVRRLLKPGGHLFLSANSLHHKWYLRAYIRATDLLHLVWNPHKLEWGDKLMRRASRQVSANAHSARSHWFDVNEIKAELQEAGLTPIQVTGERRAATDPRGSTDNLAGLGWLVVLVRKDASS